MTFIVTQTSGTPFCASDPFLVDGVRPLDLCLVKLTVPGGHTSKTGAVAGNSQVGPHAVTTKGFELLLGVSSFLEAEGNKSIPAHVSTS
ncbi:unnamed protein product [Merluccius merluccius]